MSDLRVIAPGMLTTVQDLGRWGFQSSGVPVAGPMDAYSHRLANALVGNAGDDATLEVTLVGPALECDDERVIAMSGAEFELTVDERRVPMHTALTLRPRSRLKCGRRLRGARAYLAVSGGIDVPRVLGSRSTHLASRMGGFAGRALRAGDRLPLGPHHDSRRPGLPEQLRKTVGLPERDARVEAGLERERRGRLGATRARSGAHQQTDVPDGHATVRVLPGPHHDLFRPDALAALQALPYRIDPQSNRMGFRLDGALLAQVGAGEMISDATTMGALQVPSSGSPILLMADRQTTGGYRTIATVITADLGLAGQLAPGDSIAFIVCSRAEAMAALIARERLILAATSSGTL